MAIENQPSVYARRAWDEAVAIEEAKGQTLPHPGAESIRVFQGPPKTSAEGLMEHAAPIPTVDTNSPGTGRTLRTTATEAERPPTIWADAPTTTAEPDDIVWWDSHGTPIQSVPDSEFWQDLVEMDELEHEDTHEGPTKTRLGDQRLPTIRADAQVPIQDLVIDDIRERKQVGIDRYGTALQPFNDRDVDRDLYEELVDAVMYLRQRRVERKVLREVVEELADELVSLLGGVHPSVADKLAFLANGLNSE